MNTQIVFSQNTLAHHKFTKLFWDWLKINRMRTHEICLVSEPYIYIHPEYGYMAFKYSLPRNVAVGDNGSYSFGTIQDSYIFEQNVKGNCIAVAPRGSISDMQLKNPEVFYELLFNSYKALPFTEENFDHCWAINAMKFLTK